MPLVSLVWLAWTCSMLYSYYSDSVQCAHIQAYLYTHAHVCYVLRSNHSFYSVYSLVILRFFQQAVAFTSHNTRERYVFSSLCFIYFISICAWIGIHLKVKMWSNISAWNWLYRDWAEWVNDKKTKREKARVRDMKRKNGESKNKKTVSNNNNNRERI